MITKWKQYLGWLLGLLIPVAFAASLGGPAEPQRIRGTDIETTRATLVCHTFSGHGTTPEGDLYFDVGGGDGRYILPFEKITSRRQLTDAQIETTLAAFIEQKFCLADNQIELDVQDGKFVNVTWFNR